MPQEQQKEIQNELDELFDGVTNDEEFEKRMDQFEDMHTPKYEIYQKCREEFRSVLDGYIAGTLPKDKDKALLLLKSKYHRMNEEILEIEKRGGFLKIDDVPEEFMDISMGVTKYYIEMKHSIESIDKSNTHEMDLTERSLNFLISHFPELAKDYPLLVKHGFWKNTEKGPRLGKSKQSLAEYFKSIQPKEMKRLPWSQIEKLFGEKDLKNSASTNGNSYTECQDGKRPKNKKSSKCFEEWLKIKNA